MIIGLLLHEYVEQVDKTSTTDRLDVKMSKKAEICKGTVDNRTTLKVIDLTWLNEKVVPDS